MGVRVLGTLEVGDPARPTVLPGAMRRRLLAVLTVTPGVERSADELVDALWGDAATASSVGTLQSHLTRLRHDLPDSSMVVTGPRGYRLDVPRDDIDACRFVDGASLGARLLADGDAVGASEALSGALSLWRGPAYGEFAGVPVLEAEAARLESLRVDASEQLLGAELARGDGVPPVAALEAFVDSYPTREGAWALLVRALYRSGRQADALAAFRRARDLLHDELGIEPGRELRELEEQVLRQDPALDAPVTATAADPVRLTGERRPVSVVTVAARDRGDDDGLRDLVVDLAARYGGSARLGVDGRLVAVLGWPAAHEDDAERAVRLGSAVVDSARSVGRSVAVGVATGRVDGTGDDAVPMGRPLVASSGLAHAAQPGQVLLDPATVARVGAVAEVRVDDGGSAVLLALRTAAPDPRTLSGTPFVGRERDLATLHAVVDQAVGDRRAHLVTVVADAGVGKSRLVRELAEQLGGRVLWRTGNCRPYGDRVVYAPLLDIVRRQAGIADDDGDEALRAKLSRLVPGSDAGLVVDRLAPLLGSATDLAPSRGETQRALQIVLQSLADDGPAVVHVEDIHWAPPALLDFLEALASDPEPVPLLVVTTARPELYRLRPGWGAGEAPGITLALAPLDHDEVRELLDALPLDDDEREELARRSGGNPFYAEELARFHAQSGADAGTPLALGALVEARLDSLPDAERSVLLTASVVGRRFVASQVADMLERDPDEVGGRLDALVRKQFLRRPRDAARSIDPELLFVHDLVEHAAYERLLPDDRARHHLAVASRLRGADGRGLDTRADLVAHHELAAYDAALDGHDAGLADTARARAAESALEAGTRVQGFDNATARALMSRAAELTEPGTVAHARALVRLAGVEFDAREFGRSMELIQEAMPRLEGVDEDLVVDGLLYWLIALFSTGEPFAPALGTIERGLSRMSPSRPLVRLLGWEAMVHLVAQTPESMARARDISAQAIAMADEIDCGGAGFPHVIHGRALVSLGDESGLDELERWLDDVERHEPSSAALGAWQWWAGAVHHWRGSLAEWKARERLAYLAESRGLGFLYSMGVSEHVRVLWELGRWRECVAEADEVDVSHGDAMPRWCVVQRALALADLGELDDATVAQVRRTPPADAGDLRHVVGAAAVELHAAAGDPVRAREVLESLGDWAPVVERDGAFELLPRVVRLAVQSGCGDLVAPISGIDAQGTPLRRHVATHVRGLQLLAEADRDGARRLLAVAADAWSAFGTLAEEQAARTVLATL
ncbi:MAG: BTAD domain-containing putative transcriptional regulator [Candidatus Nanopelagicales bacterium]